MANYFIQVLIPWRNHIYSVSIWHYNSLIGTIRSHHLLYIAYGTYSIDTSSRSIQCDRYESDVHRFSHADEIIVGLLDNFFFTYMEAFVQ
jgi:hypothetical protein